MTDATPMLDLARLEAASADYESGCAKRAPTSRVVSKWSRLCETMYDNLPALIAKAKEAEGLRAEVVKLKDAWDYATAGHDAVVQVISEIEAERDALQSKLRQAETARDDYEANWRSCDMRLTVMTGERDALNAELAEAKRERDELTANYVTSNTRLTSALATSEARVAELEGALKHYRQHYCERPDGCDGKLPPNVCDGCRAALLLQPTAAHTGQCGYCAGAGTGKAGQPCGGCGGTGVPAIARRAREPGGRVE